MTNVREPWLPPVPGEMPDRRESKRGIQMALGVVVFIVAEVVAFGAASALAVVLPGGVGMATGVGMLIGMTLGALGAYFGFRWLLAAVAGRPGLALAGPGRGREFGWGLLIGFGLMVASVGLIALFGGYRIVDVGWSPGILVGLAVGIGPGIIEEVFFRGMLLRLLDAWVGSWAALAITSLIFGVIHLANPGATITGALAIVMEAGLLLGAAYLLTRRLWLAFGIHIAWNATQAAVFGGNVSGAGTGRGLFEAQMTGPQWLTGGPMGIEGSLLTVLVCTSAGVAMVWLAYRRGRLLGPVGRPATRSAQ